MPRNLSVYRCLIISPSDLAEEREALVKAISGWNAHIGRGRGVMVEAVLWETHSRPEVGAPPQATLNAQLVDNDCDLGIAVFRARLGSPTETHESGSLEEIDRLLERGAQVLLYRSNVPIQPQEIERGLEQFARLQTAMDARAKRALYSRYNSVGELREQVTRHMTSLIDNSLRVAHTAPAVEPISAAVSVAASVDARLDAGEKNTTEALTVLATRLSDLERRG